MRVFNSKAGKIVGQIKAAVAAGGTDGRRLLGATGLPVLFAVVLAANGRRSGYGRASSGRRVAPRARRRYWQYDAARTGRKEHWQASGTRRGDGYRPRWEIEQLC
jgi:hypothetical protein